MHAEKKTNSLGFQDFMKTNNNGKEFPPAPVRRGPFNRGLAGPSLGGANFTDAEGAGDGGPPPWVEVREAVEVGGGQHPARVLWVQHPRGRGAPSAIWGRCPLLIAMAPVTCRLCYCTMFGNGSWRVSIELVGDGVIMHLVVMLLFLLLWIFIPPTPPTNGQIQPNRTRGTYEKGNIGQGALGKGGCNCVYIFVSRGLGSKQTYFLPLLRVRYMCWG